MEKPPFSSMIFLWPVSYRNWSVRCHSFDPPLLPPIIFTSFSIPDLDEENIYPQRQSVCIHILYIYTVLITLKVSGAMFNLIIHTFLNMCPPKRNWFHWTCPSTKPSQLSDVHPHRLLPAGDALPGFWSAAQGRWKSCWCCRHLKHQPYQPFRNEPRISTFDPHHFRLNVAWLNFETSNAFHNFEKGPRTSTLPTVGLGLPEKVSQESNFHKPISSSNWLSNIWVRLKICIPSIGDIPSHTGHELGVKLQFWDTQISTVPRIEFIRWEKRPFFILGA